MLPAGALAVEALLAERELASDQCLGAESRRFTLLAKVQAQLHRAGTQITQPLRRGLRQVQGHDVVVTEGATHHILGRQLVVLLGQADQATTTALGKARRLDRDTGILQRLAGTIEIGGVDIASLSEGELADWRAATGSGCR